MSNYYYLDWSKGIWVYTWTATYSEELKKGDEK